MQGLVTNENPLVSVVIATYNMGQYLPDALNSVLEQNWVNLEVIVVDDGSEDGTTHLISKFLIDPRLRYIRTTKNGQPKAKNRGIRESKGQYIAFCDADDLWQPNKLLVQMPYFDNPKIGVVYSDVKYIDQNGIDIEKNNNYKRYSGNITNKLAIKNFIPFGTAVLRRSCLERNGVFDESLPMGIDWDLWLRYSVDWEFKYVPKQTYVYRMWPGQMSKNYRGRYENAILILKKFIAENPEIIPDKVVSRAWSDIYVSRGMEIAAAEKTFVEPFEDLILAIKNDITYLRAWRSLIKFLLRKI